MAGALADARGAAHGARPVALERGPLVGVGLGDLQLVADELGVGLRVGDRRFEPLAPVAGRGAGGEVEDRAGFGHRLAADVVAHQACLAGGGANVAGLGSDGYRAVARGVAGPSWGDGGWAVGVGAGASVSSTGFASSAGSSFLRVRRRRGL